jgi:hypothetical protein
LPSIIPNHPNHINWYWLMKRLLLSWLSGKRPVREIPHESKINEDTNIMNFRTLRENDLADFAENVATQLAGTGLTAIDAAVRSDLVTAIGTLPQTLATQAAEASAAEAARKAAVSARNATRHWSPGL